MSGNRAEQCYRCNKVLKGQSYVTDSMGWVCKCDEPDTISPFIKQLLKADDELAK